MTSPPIRMPRKNSVSIAAHDLVGLLHADDKNGYLRHRRVSRLIKKVTWPHRFVVLAQNAIYVYNNETSATPTSNIPLLGYVAVEREPPAPKCAWVFSLVPGVPSLPRQSFATANDGERKEWMFRVKEHLYKANNVPKTSLTKAHQAARDKIKLMENVTPEEEEFLQIELPVKMAEEMKSETTNQSLKFSDASSDESDDDDDDDDDDNDETDAPIVESKDVKSPGNKSIKARAMLPPPSSSIKRPAANPADGAPPGRTSTSTPPRYSDVMRGDDCGYQNLPGDTATPKSRNLETACTIVDEAINTDRDKCNQMLKATKRVGTYLVRKSRTSADSKVLAVLVSDDAVREYKVEKEAGLFRLNVHKEFPSMESLLAHFTSQEKLPNYDGFLGYGIHEYVEGGENYESLDDC